MHTRTLLSSLLLLLAASCSSDVESLTGRGQATEAAPAKSGTADGGKDTTGVTVGGDDVVFDDDTTDTAGRPTTGIVVPVME